MKITTLLRIMFSALFVLILLFSMDSCKKDNNNNSTPANDSTAANQSASSIAADNAYDDVFETAIQTGYDNNIAYRVSLPENGQVESNAVHDRAGTTGSNSINGCAIYTVTPNDTTTFPKTIIVDFGSGCTSSTGVTRKGKITYIYSGKLIYPGTTVSATFTNYSVNGYQLQGTYSITNNSSLSGIAFTTKVTGGQITFPDASTYSYSGNKTVTQTAGSSTLIDPTDDVYSISGNGNFSSNGNTLVNNISTPLSKAYSCKWVQSGIVSFTYNSNTKGTFDFGAGTCDANAVIKVGALTLNVTLQ
ncbi:MAG: hypothetical protein ACHQET_04565 [Chitinophagales bacterium]